jgi:ATP/maltotriose-dependent transcriptional regulator MalT
VNLASYHERHDRFPEMLAEIAAGEAAVVRFGLNETFGIALRTMAATWFVASGRWADADRYSAGYRDVRGGLRLRVLTARAMLHTGRGEFDLAEALVTELLNLLGTSTEPQVLEPAYAVATELALWRGDPAAARQTVAAGLRRAGDRRVHRLRWLGLRAEADARPAVLAVVARLRDLPCPVEIPREEAYVRLADAELTRIEGGTDPSAWDEAAGLWTTVGAHYLAAYPVLRAGEAYLGKGDRPAATGRLREINELATGIGAAPLLARVHGLARRGRLRLAEDPPGERDRPGGLTNREADVLALMATGLTNRGIAGRLFISEHTVGVHVSRVLTKLGAARRTEAVAIARHLGILPTDGEISNH